MRLLSITLLLAHSLLGQAVPAPAALLGVRTVGPLRLNAARPEGVLDLTLDRPEELAIFDVVATDPSAKISLTLPGGRVIDTPDGSDGGLMWATWIQNRLSPPFDGGFLHLPNREGTHRLFLLDSAPQGRYRARAQVAGGESELTMTFVPGATLDAGDNDVSGYPPTDVFLEVLAPPPGEYYVGDSYDFSVRLRGAPVTEPVKIRVQLDYRAPQGKDATGALLWGPSIVEDAKVALTQTPEGRYAGRILLTKPGLLQMGIQVSGTTAAGKMFSEQDKLLPMNVNPVSARFVSLREKAIPRAGTGKWERLDVTARLDVVVPGNFEMRLEVTNGDSKDVGGLFASGHATLSAGVQNLTVSIPAETLRKNLKDGPWKIWGVQIFRPEGDSFGNFVRTGQLTLNTAAYKRDQLDRGDAFIDEDITVRGVYPASSGRFRMIEILLGITTPGGSCNWHGDLGDIGVNSLGVLPKGRTVLSFVFDATWLLTRKGVSYFAETIQCAGSEFANDHAKPLYSVTVDPAQFEPPSSLYLSSGMMLRLNPGATGTAVLAVYGKKPEEVFVKPLGQISGLDVSQPQRGSAVINVRVDPATKPGRYFVPIVATAENATANTAVVVDVIP